MVQHECAAAGARCRGPIVVPCAPSIVPPGKCAPRRKSDSTVRREMQWARGGRAAGAGRGAYKVTLLLTLLWYSAIRSSYFNELIQTDTPRTSRTTQHEHRNCEHEHPLALSTHLAVPICCTLLALPHTVGHTTHRSHCSQLLPSRLRCLGPRALGFRLPQPTPLCAFS